MNISAAFITGDEGPCVVVQVDPAVVDDHRLVSLAQSLLAKCEELRGVPTVLASRRDETSEPLFCGQPERVRRIQQIGWQNIHFDNCAISVRA
jgi:hypothetical protein